MSAPFQRVPFARADTDAVLALCARQPLGDFDQELRRRFLTLLSSAPEGVLLYAGLDGGLALAAVVIDLPENGADAATLEMIGGMAGPSRELFERQLLPDAIAFARAGVRSALQMSVPAFVDGAEAALASLGFVRAFDHFQMRLRAGSPPPARAPRPGWRWAPLDDALAPAVHDGLREAFRGAPSFALAGLDVFRRVAPRIAPGWRVLLDGDHVAGFVQLVMHEHPRGELRTVGRVPAYRGQGLGDELMVEALRVLWAAGAREIELGVEAGNDGALDLYRRFGFEIVARHPWWQLPLPAP